MSGINKVILIGNLGADPEVKHLQNGTPVANFRIATTETYRVKATGQDGHENWENREHTEWHNIVAWRGLATISERYLKKGSKIYVEGKLRTRKWEKDGIDRYITEIQADELTMLDRPTGDRANTDVQGAQPQRQPAATAAAATSAPPPADDMDDLPF